MSAGGVAGSVAITGVGILTPLGDELGAVGAALVEGRRSLVAALDVPDVGESRFAEFEATKYANVRGMQLPGVGTDKQHHPANLAS